jgi:DNA-binding MurR/RpiR family transcriptional regulator
MNADVTPSDLRPFEQELASRAADARGRLSANDEKILEYLHDNLDELPFHTSDSLGHDVGVSRAAVVRFAGKLGFSGFAEMQRASRDAVRQSQESPLSRFSAGSDSVLEQKALQDSRNVLATEALIRETIAPAAKSVAEADRVFLVAARRSGGLIVHLHRLLAGIRPEVHLVDPGFPDEIAEAGKGDVVVACLFRRYSRLTVDLLKLARAAKARAILVTDGRGHDFAADADQVIAAAAHSPTLYDSMVGPLFALEALVAEVAAVDPQRSKARLKAVEDFTRANRLLLG